MRNEHYSSACLAQGIKNRDPKAFRYIAKNIEPKARKMLSLYDTTKDEQNDIMQQTYLAVMIKIDDGKYNENGQFEAWFKKIAKYSFFKFREMRNKLNEAYPLSETSKVSTMTKKEIVLRLVKNVNNLSSKEKNIISLHFLDGLDYQEISEYLNQSYNNTKVTMSRAKHKICSWLKANPYFKSLVWKI